LSWPDFRAERGKLPYLVKYTVRERILICQNIGPARFVPRWLRGVNFFFDLCISMQIKYLISKYQYLTCFDLKCPNVKTSTTDPTLGLRIVIGRLVGGRVNGRFYQRILRNSAFFNVPEENLVSLSVIFTSVFNS
jgi:hypothetical protein